MRSLAFGDESQFSRFHSYYLAGFATPNYFNLDNTGLMYTSPARRAFNKMTTKAASNIALPRYHEVCPARPASQP